MRSSAYNRGDAESAEVNVRNERVFRGRDWAAFAFLTAAAVSALVYFCALLLSAGDIREHPVAYALLVGVFLAFAANSLGRWFLLPLMARPEPLPPPDGLRVAVVTTFVPGAEPLEMLEATLRAMLGIDYPHDTWVLDEGDDPEVRALCERLGAVHFSRKNVEQYQQDGGRFQSRSRHGNYNAWLSTVGFDRYDVLTQFDTDHVPRPDFLSRVLGYFRDPGVGYVQAAQVYYNQKASFIARGGAQETYSFYSVVQMASYRLGYPVIIGCHSTHRMEALKEVGGFAPHDADDILITLLYRSSRWRGVYVPEALAAGVAPVDWVGYMIQQLKWARSVLDIKLRHYARVAEDLPLATRAIGFLHGLSYLQKSFSIVVLLGLLIVFLALGRAPEIISYGALGGLLAVYLVLQLCSLYRQRFYLDWRNERGIPWRVWLLEYAKWPYLILAFFEVVANRRRPFPMNPKVRGNSNPWLLWPHLVVSIVVALALIPGIVGLVDPGPPLLQAVGLVVSGGSLLLFASGWIEFPEPYDKKLALNFVEADEPRGARASSKGQ